MASGITNRGKYVLGCLALRGDMGTYGSAPANWEARLVSSTPSATTNTMADLTEVAGGSGYAAVTLERSAVGWDTVAEDDGNSQATFKAKDISWTASGDVIGPATYLVICTPGAGDSSRYVIGYWDLGGSLSIPDGQTRTFQDTQADLYE